MKSLQYINYDKDILAIVIRASVVNEMKQSEKKLIFATPENFPFQTGLHIWDKGKQIDEHFHLPFKKLDNLPVQEFFYIIKGKIKIDLFYDIKNPRKVKESNYVVVLDHPEAPLVPSGPRI